jgi:hypothetical protein
LLSTNERGVTEGWWNEGETMKKIVSALLSVATLGGTALAADQETKDAAKTAREKQYVEESHEARPAKKQQPAKKPAGNSTTPEKPQTETKPETAPAPAK